MAAFETEVSSMRKDLFSGTFFLVISILVTASAAASIMNGIPDVIAILFSVAAWLIYASCCESGPCRGFRLGSGTAKALFIVNWVAVGLLTVLAAAVMFLPTGIYDSILPYGRLYIHSGLFGDDAAAMNWLVHVLGSSAYIWIGLVLLIMAAAILVINLFYGRFLMYFARSLRFSAEEDVWDVERAEAVSKWMFVLGIIASCGVLSVFSDGMGAFQCGCSGAAMIVASRWIKYDILPTLDPEPMEAQSEWYSPED